MAQVKKNFKIEHQGAKPALRLVLVPCFVGLAVNGDCYTPSSAAYPASVLGIKKPSRGVGVVSAAA